MIFYIKIVVLSILSLYLVQYSYRHLLIPYLENKKLKKWMSTPQLKNAYDTFQALYSSVNCHAVAKRAKAQLNWNDTSLVYGEINFLSFAQCLEIVKPTENDVFYDLGGGGGKPSFAISLLYNIKAVKTIELLMPLHKLSLRLLDKLHSLPLRHKYFADRDFAIECINSNFLDYDFSDADIIHINATAYFGDLWEALLQKLNQLKSGARVIISTKSLHPDYFELLDMNFRLMSWGVCSVRIYLKR